jgi:aminoglycoside/choline kinase family phosphotransferase
VAEGGEDPGLDARVRRGVRQALGARVARIEWLPGQLGTRRFARVHLRGAAPATLIARLDAPEDPAGRPPGIPPEPPLEPIRARLEAEGLPVPARIGGDAGEGIDLLEDLGDLTLRDAAAQAGPDERRALYEEACDLVPRLQCVRGGEIEAFRRRLDDAHFAYKAELFAAHALAPDAGVARRTVVREAFARIAAAVREAPARLAHRDFQSANLIVRPGRPAGARLAMIDLQGALLAPPEYDLVCLLRDSYVELPEAELEHHLARTRPRLPDAPAPDAFEQRFDLLTLSRKGKDVARFLYAARERADPRFLGYVPATLRALRRAARRVASRDPAFAAFAALLAEIGEPPCAP